MVRVETVASKRYVSKRFASKQYGLKRYETRPDPKLVSCGNTCRPKTHCDPKPVPAETRVGLKPVPNRPRPDPKPASC
ncbi:hypothetical protein HanPSC8_Chr14g0631991 [Helianthus annuus]|nr:hypothetical protein HanPSC8_Chr14g0631991 [Helianthus annuus]